MSKLPLKLRIYKATTKKRNIEIAEKIGVRTQSIVDWCSDERCPEKIQRDHAEKLVKLTDGYITMKDCGWK
jgi:hypothetical protein